MRLSGKITCWVFGVCFLAFSGMLAISFYSARSFLVGQLQHTAQTTSLMVAKTLENPQWLTDKTLLQALLQHAAKSSDMTRIDIRDNSGTVLASRVQSADEQATPGVFARFADLPNATASQLILYHDQPIGRVDVSANGHAALQSLWTFSMNLVIWSTLTALLALTMIGLLVRRFLRPLQRITTQARNLLNDEYNLPNRLPRTPELRDLTLAMNKMVRKIQTLFREQSRRVEVLRQQAFQDPLTGLGNRRFFLHQVTALSSDAEDFVPYYLLFIAVDGLSELNEKEGYVQGDKLIVEAHQVISKFAINQPVACIARIGGSQFGILVKAQDMDRLTRASHELQRNLDTRLSKSGTCQVFIGGAPCRFLQPLESLLREADKALQTAREGRDPVHMLHAPEDAPSDEVLAELLEHGQLALYWQKISDTRRTLHRKVFARILSAQGEEYGTNALLPVAEQAGLAWKMDCMILAAFGHVDPHNLEPFSLALSSNTVTEQDHLDEYLKGLTRLPAALRRLIRIDIPEGLVMSSPEAVKRCLAPLQKLGVGIGIDQAGIHFSSMDYLKDLPIHYFKLHGSLTRDIVENESKHVFIQHFAIMANTMEIPVIATQVDDEAQWHALNTAGIAWGQGRFIGGVEPIPGLQAPSASRVNETLDEALL